MTGSVYIDIHWFCRRHTSIKNTWQKTRYFNVDFDSNGLFILFIFQTTTFNLEKKGISFWAISVIIKSVRKGIDKLAKRLF